jgi:N-methylhydantoinase B
MSIDPITVEVIRHALEATAQEMSTVMLRTSHAPIFSEGKDYSCALYDARGEPIAQAHDCPIHLASIQFGLKQALRDLEEPLEPGDTIIMNDPYLGGSHLPDVTLFKPVYVGGELAFFAANRAHHVDVGGGAPGSFVANATEIYQEGLRLPPIKLYRRGELDKGLMRLILQNVRQPEYMYGDLHAQLAALTHAEGRIVNDLVPRFSLETILASIEPILAYSEARLRSAIAELRDGEFSAEDHLDNDGVEDKPLTVKATVYKRADELHVDFDGTSPQAKGPVNSVFAVTAGATFIAALASLEPSVPVNGGCYRPIVIAAPRGSVVNPNEPAPCVAGNTYTSIRIIDVVRRALVAAGAPHRAAGHGEHAQLLAGGTDPANAAPYVFYEQPVGGWGATPETDGVSAVFSINANCEDTPIEVFETRFPWRIRRRELRRGSGGEGSRRGGHGTTVEYELVRGEARVSLACDRQKFAPPGAEGGSPGGNADFFLISNGDRRRLPSKVTNLAVSAGDVVVVQTAGGGGWGTG